MVREARYRSVACGMPAAPMAWLLVALLVGCGGSASPEHVEAVAKLQQLGARINFKRGGYEVDLKETAISDNDLVHLQKIDNLRIVQLMGTRISDDGLEYLKPIKTLEHVDLTGSTVTREGIAELKKALPETAVIP
jgi:hypothetical protein